MTAMDPGTPVSPPDPLAVESIVAAIGMAPFVTGKLTRVHGYHQDRAAKLKETVAAKIHRFLAREEREPAAELPAFDFGEVAAALGAPLGPVSAEHQPGLSQEQVVREIAAFGEDADTAVSANVTVQRIRAYLQAKLPRLIRQSLAGPISEMPPPSEVARFRRLWVVACEPLSVLDDLNEFALSRDQVTACAEMFPIVWGTFWPVAQEQIARRMTVSEGKYRLTHRKELLLRVLTRQEATNVALGQALQALFAKAAQPAAPGAPAGGKADKDSMSNEASESARI
jgi:hypothetical protein